MQNNNDKTEKPSKKTTAVQTAEKKDAPSKATKAGVLPKKKKKIRVVLAKKGTETQKLSERKKILQQGAQTLGMTDKPLQLSRPSYSSSKNGTKTSKPTYRQKTAPPAIPRPGSKGSAPPPIPPAASSGKRFFKKKQQNYRGAKEKQEIDIFSNPTKKTHVVRKNPVPSLIEITESISVAELARKMNLKASDLIQRLISMGMMVSINEGIDAETAAILANEYKCEVKVVSLYDQTIIETEEGDERDLKPRPPIATILGHVDHGKTTLLDAIRNTSVASGEHGAITQHIGAYQTHTDKGTITFLDTPGHEAFTQMRSRGAQITDIAVLIVAADDGVMPQTIEAINHVKAADVPFIVAITKIDLPSANPERIRHRLSEFDLIPEEWGGKTVFVEVSAVSGEGIPELLDAIILQAEIMELKANYSCRAEGKVIESMIDPGLGKTSTVLVERGTLKIGDSFAAGIFPGKVRMIINDHNERIKTALPSMPVRVIGFDGIPQPGDPFQVTENERLARQVCLKRQELKQKQNTFSSRDRSLGTLFDENIGEQQELRVIIKGDVLGSVEAIKQALEKLTNDKVKLSCVHASAGAINESDIMLAAASSAIVVGFHVRPTSKAQTLSEQEKIEIYKCSIVYDVIETIKSRMSGLLAPELQESIIGTAKIRKVYKTSRGTIIGGYVTDGQMQRGAFIRLYREGEEIYTGKLSSLKRFKDDAKTVEAGFECGMTLDNFDNVKEDDVLEAFIEKEVKQEMP